MLPKNFYKDVEIPGNLKRVLYSDSVAENHTLLIQFKNNSHVNSIQFNRLWDYLVNKLQLEVIKQNNKEYIYIIDQIKVINYNVNNDDIKSSVPSYIMRHYVEDKLIRLNLTNDSYLDVTQNHSMLNYNKHKLKFDIVKPKNIIYLPIINNQEILNNSKLLSNCTYFENRITPLKHIKALKINNKEIINYKGYIYDVEIPKTHNYFTDGILVHNTDSIYIIIPTVIPANEMKKEERWTKLISVAKDINDAIIKYMKEYYLPRSNILPTHNMTNFKTELLMTSMFFTGVKKHYAYNTECIEGNFLEKPEVEYKGVPIVKSNAAKLSQNMLREMIEGVMLNLNVKVEDKEKALMDVVNNQMKLFQNDIKKLEFKNIGIPSKWGRQIQIVNGMLLYNLIMGQEVFNSGSSGRFIYCQFRNKNKFNKEIDIDKTTGLCVPYEYDVKLLKEKLNKFGIIIDGKLQWSKLFSTTCTRVVNSCKFL